MVSLFTNKKTHKVFYQVMTEDSQWNHILPSLKELQNLCHEIDNLQQREETLADVQRQQHVDHLKQGLWQLIAPHAQKYPFLVDPSKRPPPLHLPGASLLDFSMYTPYPPNWSNASTLPSLEPVSETAMSLPSTTL